MRISDWSSDVCSSDLNEVGDVLLHFERLVRKDRLAQALGPIRGGAMLHPGAQAPPLGAGRAHFVGQVRLGNIRIVDVRDGIPGQIPRSEEHTSELQSLMRNSYAVF